MNNKHYTIEVGDLSYGGLRKKIVTYPEARRYYVNISNKLANSPCTITMKKIEEHPQTGEVIENIQYIDKPGKAVKLENKLQQLKVIVDEIFELQESFKATVNETDEDLFFNMRHALELGLGSKLSEAESKNVLENLHLEGLIRRSAKSELTKHNYCKQSLALLKTTVNKAIIDCEKLRKENSKIKTVQDIKYENTLMKLAAANY